ncbi:MAG: T9SS type A sorting domain-containing protein [Saprospiraceae bacterium]|nr:T9SS type A sorting domain-containing protein [Saprospiraceae bacterium]
MWRKSRPAHADTYVAATSQGVPVNNWSAYLKDDPSPVADQFSPATTPDIFRVLNMPTGPNGNLTPQSYLVTLQSGANFQMKTGSGYILNASADGEFTYGFGGSQVDDRSLESLPVHIENSCQYFLTPFQSTLQAATVIFPKSLLEMNLTRGDEIGIVNRKGELYGSGRYDGYSLAMVATGDDAITSSHIEGFAEGETMFFRVWKKGEEKAFDVKVVFENGSDSFAAEGVFMAMDLEIQQVSSIQDELKEIQWSAYPNPATSTLNFDIHLSDASPLHLELLSHDGRQVANIYNGKTDVGRTKLQVNVNTFPAGIYLVRLTTKQGVSVKKIIISN